VYIVRESSTLILSPNEGISFTWHPIPTHLNVGSEQLSAICAHHLVHQRCQQPAGGEAHCRWGACLTIPTAPPPTHSLTQEHLFSFHTHTYTTSPLPHRLPHLTLPLTLVHFLSTFPHTILPLPPTHSH